MEEVIEKREVIETRGVIIETKRSYRNVKV
jgi:hypothetical protein